MPLPPINNFDFEQIINQDRLPVFSAGGAMRHNSYFATMRQSPRKMVDAKSQTDLLTPTAAANIGATWTPRMASGSPQCDHERLLAAAAVLAQPQTYGPRGVMIPGMTGGTTIMTSLLPRSGSGREEDGGKSVAIPDSHSVLDASSINVNDRGSMKDINGRFFKTRMCLFHQRGACIKGDACSYAHTDVEKRPVPDLVKTRLCQDWLNGSCANPANCKFAHGRHELRYTQDFYKTKICHFWQQGGCTKGAMCRHAHGAHELRPLPDGASLLPASGSPRASSTGASGSEQISMILAGDNSPCAIASEPLPHPVTYTEAAAIFPSISGAAPGLAEELLSAAAAAAAAAAAQPPLSRVEHHDLQETGASLYQSQSISGIVGSETVMEALRLATEARKCLERGAELLLAANQQQQQQCRREQPASLQLPTPRDGYQVASAFNTITGAVAQKFRAPVGPASFVSPSFRSRGGITSYTSSQAVTAAPEPSVLPIKQESTPVHTGVSQHRYPAAKPVVGRSDSVRNSYVSTPPPDSGVPTFSDRRSTDADWNLPSGSAPDSTEQCSNVCSLFPHDVAAAAGGGINRPQQEPHRSGIPHPNACSLKYSPSELSDGSTPADVAGESTIPSAGSTAILPAGQVELSSAIALGGFTIEEDSAVSVSKNELDPLQSVNSPTDDALGELILHILRSTPSDGTQATSNSSGCGAGAGAGNSFGDDGSTPSTAPSCDLMATFNDVLSSHQVSAPEESRTPTQFGLAGAAGEQSKFGLSETPVEQPKLSEQHESTVDQDDELSGYPEGSLTSFVRHQLENSHATHHT